MNTSEKHAVVLGGSLAGLVAARVLADHFDRVTLIERDAYSENCETRRGIPQANQALFHPRVLFRVLLNHGLYGSVKIDLHRSVQSVAETT